jgi:hypothetical protein
MPKLSKTEQEFQKWLAALRAGQESVLGVLVVTADMTDDRLRELWKDDRRRQQKRARDKKYIAAARAAYAAEWAKRKRKE